LRCEFSGHAEPGRDRTGIGDKVRHREKWRLALDMLDEMTGQWDLPRLPVAADSGCGDSAMFRLGLAERGLRQVVQVDPAATAHQHEGAGRPVAVARLRASFASSGRVSSDGGGAANDLVRCGLRPAAFRRLA
jgi:hypothetical protein